MKLSRDPNAFRNLPATTVLLKHMYDPEEETETHWELSIADEVKDECSKYGPVTHIEVTKSKDGEVYLKFLNIPSAQAAVNALNGRWFGGKQIVASFVRPDEYHRLFPSA